MIEYMCAAVTNSLPTCKPISFEIILDSLLKGWFTLGVAQERHIPL